MRHIIHRGERIIGDVGQRSDTVCRCCITGRGSRGSWWRLLSWEFLTGSLADILSQRIVLKEEIRLFYLLGREWANPRRCLPAEIVGLIVHALGGIKRRGSIEWLVAQAAGNDLIWTRFWPFDLWLRLCPRALGSTVIPLIG